MKQTERERQELLMLLCEIIELCDNTRPLHVVLGEVAYESYMKGVEDGERGRHYEDDIHIEELKALVLDILSHHMEGAEGDIYDLISNVAIQAYNRGVEHGRE